MAAGRSAPVTMDLPCFMMEDAMTTTQRPRTGGKLRRRIIRVVAVSAAGLVLLVAAWVLLGPLVMKRYAIHVRRQNEPICPELAGAYWTSDLWTGLSRRSLNWVGENVVVAMAPLSLDLGRRGSVDKGVPAVMPAEGVDELGPWLERELASPSGTMAPLPGTCVRLLARRGDDLDRVRAILLSVDVPAGARLGHESAWTRKLLLTRALLRAQQGRHDEAALDILAVWRLARVLRTAGLESARDVAIVLRKLPEAPVEWENRLSIEPFRQSVVDAHAHDAAWALQCAEDVPRCAELTGRDRHRLSDPLYAWYQIDEARRTLAFVQAYRRPERFGPVRPDPWEWHGMPSSTGDARARRLDVLRAQVELTRKVLLLRRMRADDGTWPKVVPGIEHSAYGGLEWRYTGGDRMSLEPAGSAAEWLRPDECEPALSFSLP
jgi:hypothetical protein